MPHLLTLRFARVSTLNVIISICSTMTTLEHVFAIYICLYKQETQGTKIR